MMSFGKFLTIFIIISAIVLGIAGFWYYQKNIYSKEILKLEIIGPEKAEAGDEVEYTVKYKNNGNVRLEQAKLIFEYPQNSLPLNEQSVWVEKKLDDIYPGEERTLEFSGIILGKEQELKTARALLTYQPKNLNAFYDSETTFTTLIDFVPLTFEFDFPTKIEPDKNFYFRINYFSNINYPLSDLRCVIEYPSNFEFVSASPQPLDKTEWEIGILNKTEGGRIEVAGKISGTAGDQKIFRARLGVWQKGEFVLLKEIAKGLEIIKPSLYISQMINGNSQYTANAGELLRYEVFFKNIGQQPLTNLFLIMKLEGDVLDFESLRSNTGEFKSGDNSIIWDWKKIPQLQFLDAQQEGFVEFWIKVKEDWPISETKGKNPNIINRVFLSQVEEEFITKVNSKIEIVQKGYFNNAAHLPSEMGEPRPEEGREVFDNSGPLPPRVGESTTYAIIWQVKNFFNNMKNVKVKTVLPNQVKMTGEIFPKEGKITFDSQSREIVWEVGEVEAGAGINKPGPNIAFQISFVPNPQQKGNIATLISETTITGDDAFTETVLTNKAGVIDTTLPDDETVSQEGGIVQ